MFVRRRTEIWFYAENKHFVNQFQREVRQSEEPDNHWSALFLYPLSIFHF